MGNERHRMKRTTARFCLKCYKAFRSTGIGNRICRGCQDANDKMGMGNPMGKSARHMIGEGE